MKESISAKAFDLEGVQVYPLSLVKLDGLDAKVKSMTAEKLCDVGVIELIVGCNRFANELGRRDYVTPQEEFTVNWMH